VFLGSIFSNDYEAVFSIEGIEIGRSNGDGYTIGASTYTDETLGEQAVPTTTFGEQLVQTTPNVLRRSKVGEVVPLTLDSGRIRVFLKHWACA